MDCDQLTKVSISEGVKSIGNSAFLNCYSLKKATIPDTVTDIGDHAFHYESDLSTEENPLFEPLTDLQIEGIIGSYAETYAEENKFTFVVIVKLSAPSDLTLKADIGQVTVQWKAVSGVLTGYQIQYSKNASMEGRKTVTVPKSPLKRTIKELDDHTKYYFRIRAYYRYRDKDYYSSWSAKKSRTTVKLAKPDDFGVSGGKGMATVSWRKVSGATGYKIRYSTNSKMTQAKTKKASKESVRYYIRNLRKGAYYFQIRSYKVVGSKTYYSEWINRQRARIS